jgi:hypothetical protein
MRSSGSPARSPDRRAAKHTSTLDSGKLLTRAEQTHCLFKNGNIKFSEDLREKIRRTHVAQPVGQLDEAGSPKKVRLQAHSHRRPQTAHALSGRAQGGLTDLSEARQTVCSRSRIRPATAGRLPGALASVAAPPWEQQPSPPEATPDSAAPSTAPKASEHAWRPPVRQSQSEDSELLHELLRDEEALDFEALWEEPDLPPPTHSALTASVGEFTTSTLDQRCTHTCTRTRTRARTRAHARPRLHIAPSPALSPSRHSLAHLSHRVHREKHRVAGRVILT